MTTLNGFNDLAQALRITTPSRKIEELKDEIAELKAVIKMKNNQLIELSACVSRTQRFYDWLLDVEPFRRGDKINNVNLCLQFLAHEKEQQP